MSEERLVCTVTNLSTGEERVVSLRNDESSWPVTIGSSPDCVIVLEGPEISPHHAEVVASGRHCAWRPLAGDNSFAMGTKVPVGALRRAETFQIGPYQLRIHFSPSS